MALPPVLARVIAWLRAGYPEGVPDVDYIPLFALLGSELTDADVNAIADELAATGDESTVQCIKDAIERASHESRWTSTWPGFAPGSRPAAGRWPGPTTWPRWTTPPTRTAARSAAGRTVPP